MSGASISAGQLKLGSLLGSRAVTVIMTRFRYCVVEESQCATVFRPHFDGASWDAAIRMVTAVTRPTMFRHTYPTRHLRDGIDIRTLQQWMGHRDIASTMVYLKNVRNRDIQARLNSGTFVAFA